MYRRVRWRVRRRRKTAVAVAVLVIAGALTYALWPGPDLRQGSELLGEVAFEGAKRTPDAYRVVYRVERHLSGGTVVSTERLLVRRPFEAVVVRLSGPPPGEEEDGRTVVALGQLRNDELVLAVPPSPASLDRRADTFFPEAIEQGFAEPREVRRVAGRPCRVFRMASVGAQGLEPISEVSDTYTELCVDEAGLVLEEVGVTGGDISTRRLATQVDEDPDVPEGAFETGDPTIEVRMGGGSVRRLEPTSRPPGTFWEPSDPPEGLEHEGRYSVVPPQTGFDDPTERQRIIAFVSDVWRSGVDVLIIEQGATLGGTEPFAEDPNARDVRVGALGEGQLVFGASSSELRVLLGGGRFVRVFGTVEPSRLLGVARTLEEREGGELSFLDELPAEETG